MSQPTSFSGHGAVDLGALAARREAAARAAAAPSGPAPAGVVIDVTEATFEAEVVNRSMTVPVVIDLWADWCGPCKQLSPVLERLAAADAGRWVLAKVDVDANQRIAAAFQVQSIPAVFAVIKGQPVPLFQGALPEGQVRQYLDELLRVAEANGVTGRVDVEAPGEAPEPAAEPAHDPRFDEAYDAIERGDWDAAATAYRSLLDQAPGDADAKAGLAQVELMRRTDGLVPAAALSAADAAPADVDAALTAADVELLEGRVEDAFARLIACVRAVFGDERDRVRARLVELFEVVGSDDPRVAKARTALANALF
ncbi:MAG: tetratricopeptide repeat protein [Motilibacteraceae bacterium]